MKSLQDLTQDTSAYELFTFLYWKIIDGEIHTFSRLVSFIEKVPDSNKKTFVLKNCFLLIKKLYWGFFRDLTRTEYGKLWDRVTVRNRVVEYGADLKRNMTIANVYAAFIDIHGYTVFCEKAGKNPSMLRLLDESIEKEIRGLCRSHNVLSNRVRGDEIILVGPSALDIVRAVIGISEYFASKKSFVIKGVEQGRTRKSIMLPEMTISAGIAGGRKYTSLIITKSGDLSGSVVNTAARIQMFSNKLSGTGTRIVMSESVHIKFTDEAKAAKDPYLTGDSVLFVKVGTIGMKGIRVPLVEAITDPDERYRFQYQAELKAFRKSLRSHLWSGPVFTDLATLLRKMVNLMPPFSFKEIMPPTAENGVPTPCVFDNKMASEFLEAAMSTFYSGHNYQYAVEALRMVVSRLEKITSADQVVIKYARSIVEKYMLVLKEYIRELHSFSEARETSIFSLDEITAYTQLRSQAFAFRDLRDRLLSRIDADRRKILWQQGVNAIQDKLDVKLYFGK